MDNNEKKKKMVGEAWQAQVFLNFRITKFVERKYKEQM